MSDYPTIALTGPGAIGTTIAAVLHEAGRTPLLCGRTAHPELRLRYDEGETVVPGPVLTDPNVITRPVDLVFVAVKTTQNANSAVWLRAKPRLTLPDVHQAQRVVEALRDTRCAVELSEDFATVAWRKLLQNAVAGLMVLSNRRAGMFRREDISELSLAYLREGLTVARAEGAKLDDAVAEEILANFQRAPVDLGTSILADRQADRPMEWDIRNGVIQRYGRRHGIAVPISDVVVPLLATGSEGPG
ncbi:TPA: ketopantoate reductase family protein [Enterobacter hormaechei]